MLPFIFAAARVVGGFTSRLRVALAETRIQREVADLLRDILRDVARPPQIRITTNIPQVIKSLDRLQSDVSSVAMPRALNRMAQLAAVEMRRAITARYAMKAGDVRDRLRIRRAGRGQANLTAELYATNRGSRGRSINLVRFVVGGRKVSKTEARRALKAGTRAELKVRIKKGQTKAVKSAFIANKGRTAFERVGAARLPIKPSQTIDVPQMFNTREVNERVIKFIEARWPAVMDSEVKKVLNGWR